MPGKSSQKLTKFKMDVPKIDKLLCLKKIPKTAFDSLTNQEKAELISIINERIKSSTGEKLDEVLYQVDEIVNDQFRNDRWEANHINILLAMSRLMYDHGRMPGKMEIAAETGLSRQTVHKHLKEYHNHPYFKEQQQQFRFLIDNLNIKMYQMALDGNVGAAKLIYNWVDNNSKQVNTRINNQNNHIQINNIILSQDKLEKLSKGVLDKIEKLILPELEDSH